ncbi:AraC family transcriptional regulator [Glycomyces buryatensis]|uniref:AraC family transcriptional regulator n=1 Tax=Glycomyces buryatensis TaxID=2570927 RepID=A0A4S8QFJ1_9ACTN|nr:AraC family transcriptional regulator [Glycomyces buryatensis]THV41902.1 AraC family transcriptional regulator [Glycomyces buryatensis]
MDPLSSLLSGIRAEGSELCNEEMEPPWLIRCDDAAPLTMLTVVHGGVKILFGDGGEADIAGKQTAIFPDRGPIRFVDNAPGPTLAYFGSYRTTGRRHEALLRVLPNLVVIDENEEVCTLLQSATRDAASRIPGTQALVDRLFDWGLVCTLRTWFDREGASAPGWYRGFTDPVVGPALEAIHGRPAEPWTVNALAAEAGVSRALIAKRFNEVMGEPPLSYLTNWRMEMAEELLADPERTVAQVARSVGYADAFGFSNAFKRRKGMSPTEFRRDETTEALVG